MSIFNFKITGEKHDIEKSDDNFNVNYVKSSQKPKICHVCGIGIHVGQSSTTFMKKIKYVSGVKKFITYHACHPNTLKPCADALANKLNVKLP